MERITRQRLYDLVWSEPISALGPRHGISGVAFAKACRTHDIPVPPRGHWAKARVGKRMARPALPPRPLGGVETIELGRRRWHSNAIPDKDLMTMEIPSPPDFPEPLADLVGKVTVPKNLDKPHRLIAKLLEADEVRRQERSYFSAPLFASPFEQRRLRLLSGLFWALDRVDMHPSLSGKDPDSFDARVGEQHVSFSKSLQIPRITVMATPIPTWLTMHFAAQLVHLRKQRGWTQLHLADALGLHLTQVKRYETGASQPSLEALKKIALTLSISLDELVFGDAERGPDEALKLKFEALRQFDPDERKLAEGVLDSLINNHQAKRLFGRAEPTAAVAVAAPKPRREARSTAR